MGLLIRLKSNGIPEYLVYDDAPHGLFITEKDRLNADLIEFLTLGAIQTDQEEEQIPLVLNPSVS